METLLLECAVRAALVAVGTATVLWVMRIKSAVIRHAAWTAVVVAMLLLPLWSIAGPRFALRVLRPAATQVVAHGDTASTISTVTYTQHQSPTASPVAATSAPRFDWFDALTAVYLLGALVLLARLAAGTVLALRLRRSVAVQSGIATSRWCTTPITVGWLAPVAVLPVGWTEWPAAQLRAVLTHEGEHVRRRDPLVQWLALLNRAVFWFHPLAWWLERSLSALAEEACDAAVLEAGHSPQDYSQYLLDLARAVAGQQRRVHIGTAIIGSGLQDRLRLILDAAPTPRQSRARLACAVALCTTTSALFATGSLAKRPAASAQAVSLPTVTVSAEIVAPSVAPPAPQAPKTTQAVVEQYDVASIKLCDPGTVRADKPGPTHIEVSENRFYMECISAEGLVNLAYVRDGNFALNQTDLERVVRGGPDWMRSDRFTIEATTHGTPKTSVLEGSMLRALIEQRFQLRTHAASEQIPMYALTVSKDGLKIKPNAAGDCVPEDQQDSSAPAGPISAVPGQRPPCGFVGGRNRGATRIWDLGGTTLADVASLIEADREVLDQTGIKDRFNIHLEYAIDDPVGSTRRNTDVTAPTVFVALEQQLGLKLVSIKGAHRYFVIDHIERPNPNLPIETLAKAGTHR